MVRPEGPVSEPPVLVAGATGWLGARLVRALRRGLPGAPGLERPSEAPVRCLVPLEGALEPLGTLREEVEVVRGDLLDPPSLRPFTRGAEGATLLCAAGLVHPRLRVRELRRVNVDGTRALLAAAERAGVRRAVLLSSNSPIGVAPSPGVVFDEDAPYRPYLAYGRSKMELELEARAVAARGRLEVVLIRAPWFYGPGQPPRQVRFFQLIRTGRLPFPARGENLRSMAYVDDLAQGVLLAARVPSAANQTYWVADARPYPFAEIVATVEAVLEEEFGLSGRRRRRTIPPLVPALARLGDGFLQALGLYQQELHVLGELDRTIACDPGRARRELGYSPVVGLREGMRRSVEDALARGFAL
jgi:nucleoside-diphosphate-sugar epimerase